MAEDEHGNWKPDDIGFVRKSQEEIEAEGGDCSKSSRHTHFKDCPGCHMRVAIHCEQCGIQISGCLCLLVERDGPEIAAAKARERGLILPKSFTDLHG